MSNEAIDRKFSDENIQTAKELTVDYCLVIEKHDDLGYAGHCEEMPHVMADGATWKECQGNLLEAIRVVLSYMLEAGIPLPQSQTHFHSSYRSDHVVFKKVAGMEMWTEDLQHFYVCNKSGSGDIWSSESVDTLKILQKKLGEFIEEVEKCKK